MEGESNFNTSAVVDHKHGILQISDQKWCSNAIGGINECRISCDKLEDSFIADDIECARKIYQREGFDAWSTYRSRCRYHTYKYTKMCFFPDENVTDPPELTTPASARERGKIYDKCELARELRYTHRFPADQVNTWICIIENESEFNTSAVGAFNKDGSPNIGIFYFLQQNG